jgi:MFS family permease
MHLGASAEGIALGPFSAALRQDDSRGQGGDQQRELKGLGEGPLPAALLMWDWGCWHSCLTYKQGGLLPPTQAPPALAPAPGSMHLPINLQCSQAAAHLVSPVMPPASLPLNPAPQASGKPAHKTHTASPMTRPSCAGKLVMGLGVAWFSLASCLLPAALSPAVAASGMTFAAVLAARFLVGFGEGVAMPAMNNLVARHIPPALKATALGNCYTGFHTGAPAPPFTCALAAAVGLAVAVSVRWHALPVALPVGLGSLGGLAPDVQVSFVQGWKERKVGCSGGLGSGFKVGAAH